MVTRSKAAEPVAWSTGEGVSSAVRHPAVLPSLWLCNASLIKCTDDSGLTGTPTSHSHMYNIYTRVTATSPSSSPDDHAVSVFQKRKTVLQYLGWYPKESQGIPLSPSHPIFIHETR